MTQHKLFHGARPSMHSGAFRPSTPSLAQRIAAVEAAASSSDGETTTSRAGRGRTLRIALGFAALGTAAAFWAGPNMEETAYRIALGLQQGAADDFTTASIRPAAPRGAAASQGVAPTRFRTETAARGTRRYVVRRSVMQAPGEVCTINGAAETACR